MACIPVENMISLYDYELSGNCYKLRLLLHWLKLDYSRIAVNFYPGREHQSAQFIDNINPLGQLPVLVDGDFQLRDAQACLVYLASQYDHHGVWYPDDARIRGNITLWLALADEITRTASAARLHHNFGYAADLDACRAGARDAFRLLDDQLAENLSLGQRWLAARHPTVADIACFPYAALAGEAGITLHEFPALRRWIWDLRHLPGFIAMPGILDPLL